MHVPSTASYFDGTLVNAGPLTSTFTPPAACTRPLNHGIDLVLSDGFTAHWSTSCGQDTKAKRQSQCRPSESAWVNAASSDYSKDGHKRTYFSPGLACPSGWTTGGVAVLGQHSTVSSSGGGFPTKSPPPWQPFQTLPFASYFVDNMEVFETMAFCCPSGYDIDYRGYCSSTAGKPQDYGYKTVCEVYQTELTAENNVTQLHGKTYSPPLAPLPIVRGDKTTKSVDLSLLTQTSHYNAATASAVVDFVNVVVLVHKESDGKPVADEESSATAVNASLFKVTAALITGFLSRFIFL